MRQKQSQNHEHITQHGQRAVKITSMSIGLTLTLLLTYEMWALLTKTRSYFWLPGNFTFCGEFKHSSTVWSQGTFSLPVSRVITPPPAALHTAAVIFTAVTDTAAWQAWRLIHIIIIFFCNSASPLSASQISTQTLKSLNFTTNRHFN